MKTNNKNQKKHLIKGIAGAILSFGMLALSLMCSAETKAETKEAADTAVVNESDNQKNGEIASVTNDGRTSDESGTDSVVSIEIEPIDKADEEDRIENISDEVSLNFSYGFQNVAKSGRMLPFYVDITNRSGVDINGKLIIEVQGSVETDRNEFEKAAVSYSFAVNAPAGNTVKLSNTISIAESDSEAKLKLVDADGNVICEKSTAVILLQSAGSELLIGVLSNSPQKLEYLKNININGTQLRTRTVELDYNNMPENASGLEQLDMMVVSDFEIDKLTDKAVDAIKRWVENGGILLVGTGEDSDAAKKLGKGIVEDLSVSPSEDRPVNMGIKYSKGSPDDAQIELEVCDVFAADGIQVMQSDDIAMLTTVPVGSGIMGIAAYDLCDIDSFCSEELEYTDDLLKSMIGSSRLNQFVNAAENSGALYDQAERLVGIADPDRLPSAMLYILFCIAYICLLVGIYIYLRFRGLSIFYHAFVPIAAFMSAIILWLLSSGLRNDGISFDYAIMRELHDGYAQDEGFMKISSSSLKSYTLNVPSEYEVHPIVHEAGNASRGDGPEPRRGLINIAANDDLKTDGTGTIEIANTDEAATIKTAGMKAFAGMLNEYSAKVDNTEFAGISADVTAYNGYISGTVINDTEYNLEDAALVMYGRLIKLGTIKAGENIDLNGREMLEYPVGNSRSIADEMTNVNNEASGTKNQVRALRHSRLLSYYINKSLCGYFSGIKLIAFADGVDIMNDISSDSHVDSNGSMLISLQAKASFKMDGSSYQSCISTEPKLVSGEYDAARNITSGSCVVEYTLGNDIDIERLSFNRLNQAFEGDEIKAFMGAVSFYNYLTGNYDPMGETIYEGIDYEKLSDYLSPGNTITVRYTLDDDSTDTGRLYLPVPYVTGTERR